MGKKIKRQPGEYWLNDKAEFKWEIVCDDRVAIHIDRIDEDGNRVDADNVVKELNLLAEKSRSLRSACEASLRLATHAYRPWSHSGGGKECEHGINKGIACRECDLAVVRLTLAS